MELMNFPPPSPFQTLHGLEVLRACKVDGPSDRFWSFLMRMRSLLRGLVSLSLVLSCGGTPELPPRPIAAARPSAAAPLPPSSPPASLPLPSQSPPPPQSFAPPPPPAPPLPPPGRVTRVVANDVRACAIFESGRLQCWGGFNHEGELGRGHKNTERTPAWVKNIRDVKMLALADDSTCAIVGSGDLFCWGKNRFLEQDASPSVTIPAHVPGLSSVVDVAVSTYHGCAVDAAGSVFCWGSNSSGQLGLGAAAIGTETKKPTQVPGIRDAIGVAVSRETTLAWTRSGDLFRWGMASDLKAPWAAPDPRKVGGLSSVKRVRMSLHQACALLSTSEVRCFERETLASLAAGKEYDFGPELPPLLVAKMKIPRRNLIFPDGRGLSGVADVAVFNHDATAWTEKGEVFSWGNAERGTVGRPLRTKGFFPPTRIQGLSDIVEVAGSFEHRCALDRQGKVFCFGEGSPGRFGSDALTSSTSGVLVPGLPKIVQIASNDHCTFALGEDDSLWGWGVSWINACGFDDDGQTTTKAPMRVPLEPPRP